MDLLSQIIESLPSPSSITNQKKLDAALKQYAGQLANLQSNVKQVITSQPIQALEFANPQVNSIAYLAILNTILHTGPPPVGDQKRLLDSILNFILNFDPVQIRYAGKWLVSLLERIAAGNLFSPLVAVELLVTAILRIDPSGSVLTSTHLATIKLAYETDNIDAVLRLVDLDVLDFPRPMGGDSRPLCDSELPASYFVSPSIGITGKLKHDAVLEYELLCGLIYISKRNWPKAMDSLERVVAHPVKDKAVSKIMVEAYKKWILVAVLATGQLPKLPAFTSPVAKTSYGTLAEPYTELATMFVRNDTSQLLTDAEAHSSLWAEDMNEGLVKELLSAYQKWQIINLQEVYRQVSVSKIRETTISATNGQPLPDNDSVLILLGNMLQSGMLKGEIVLADEAGGESYLKFHDDASLLAEAGFARELATVQGTIEALSKEYKIVNDRLSASKDYVAHVLREQKRAEKDGQDVIAGFDAQIEDEDLMTGVMSND